MVCGAGQLWFVVLVSCGLWCWSVVVCGAGGLWFEVLMGCCFPVSRLLGMDLEEMKSFTLKMRM